MRDDSEQALDLFPNTVSSATDGISAELNCCSLSRWLPKLSGTTGPRYCWAPHLYQERL